MSEPRTCVVVLRGPSIARLHEGETILADNVPSTAGPARCTFGTIFADEGHEAAMPRGMWAQIVTKSDSLDTAIPASINVAMGVKALLSFAANASIGELQLAVAYDASTDTEEHSFVQRLLPDPPRGMPDAGRWIPIEATSAWLHALGNSPHLPTLMRAVAHYDEALRYWRPEYSVQAVDQLWIAIEGLTPALRDQEKAALGVDDAGLARHWGVEKQYAADRHNLNAEARRRLIFRGDDATYKAARGARVNYVHSLAEFPKVFELATNARDATATHVRRTVMELAGVPEAARNVLLGARYGRAFEVVPLSQMIRGTLHGRADELVAPGRLCPIFAWELKLEQFRRAKDRDAYEFRPSVNLKAAIGERATFTGQRFEIWGPTMDEPPPPNPGSHPASA